MDDTNNNLKPNLIIEDAPETDEDRAEIAEISKKTVYMPVEESPGLSKFARNYITDHAQEISDAYQAGNFATWVKGTVADIMAKHGDVWGEPLGRNCVNTPLLLPLQIFLYVVIEDDDERERLLQVVQDCITEARSTRRTHYSSTIAKEHGQHVTHIENAIAPSDIPLFPSFTGERVFKLAESVDIARAFAEDTGQLSPILTTADNLQHVLDTNVEIMATLLSYATNQYEYGEDNTIAIHLPTVFKDTDTDYRPPRPHSSKRADLPEEKELSRAETRERNKQWRLKRFMTLLTPLERYVGMLPNGSMYRFAAFAGWDAESEIVTINAPYLYKLIEANAKNLYVRKSPHLTSRDPAATEIAIYLLQRMRKRGALSDQELEERRASRKAKLEGVQFDLDPKRQKNPQITYRVSYETVIRDCPMIQSQLDEILNMKKLDTDGNPTAEPETGMKIANEFNKRARRVFGSAFRILREDTEAKNLPNLAIKNESSGEYPTKTNTRKNIVITWDTTPKNAL